MGRGMQTHRWIGAIAASMFMVGSTWADAPGEDSPSESSATAAKSVWTEASAAMQRGPQTIKLLDQAELGLPTGYGFVPRAPAVKVMDAMGNRTDERFLGMIFPLGSTNKNWFVTLSYESSGYIKDDDAKKWDADELLQNLKEGTEAGTSIDRKWVCRR